MKLAKNKRQEYNQGVNDQAHSYHPSDESLNVKVEALRFAMSDYRNARISLENQPNERIGDDEEIQFALTVSENTLSRAVHELSSDEFKQAQERGLLSKDELVDAHSTIRKIEMTAQRQQQTQTQDTHSNKI